MKSNKKSITSEDRWEYRKGKQEYHITSEMDKKLRARARA